MLYMSFTPSDSDFNVSNRCMNTSKPRFLGTAYYKLMTRNYQKVPKFQVSSPFIIIKRLIHRKELCLCNRVTSQYSKSLLNQKRVD